MKNVVSIIVPVYKAEEYLKNCVDSILAQTHCDIEVILIDDGSPDKSGSICDAYACLDSRVRVIHQDNAGPSKARNAGLDIATGEFIAFVDSDDTIEPYMFEKMTAAIGISDLAVCNYKMNYGTYTRLDKLPKEATFTQKEFWLELLHNLRSYSHFILILWNKLYRASLFQNSGNGQKIRFQEDMRVAEDSWLVFDIVKQSNKITFVDIAPYNYLIANNQNSLTKTSDAYISAGKVWAQHIFPMMKEAIPECEPEINRAAKCQNCVILTLWTHVAYMNGKPAPESLRISHIATILKYSHSCHEKISAILLYLLPATLYRKIFAIYVKIARRA